MSKYAFIEVVEKENKYEPPIECKCMIFSWKCKRDKKLYLKLDSIDNYIGKFYEKKIINGKEQ